MSQPDSDLLSGTFAALPLIPRDHQGPIFAEPWQAEAFALAVRLSAQGCFTWHEWSSTLADELQPAVARSEGDDGTRYYHHWLAALERLVVSKGLCDATALLARKKAWVEAFQRSPHGKPVQLQASLDF